MKSESSWQPEPLFLLTPRAAERRPTRFHRHRASTSPGGRRWLLTPHSLGVQSRWIHTSTAPQLACAIPLRIWHRESKKTVISPMSGGETATCLCPLAQGLADRGEIKGRGGEPRALTASPSQPPRDGGRQAEARRLTPARTARLTSLPAARPRTAP